MRLKGPRRRAARHALQDRCFHLREIPLPKVFPHRLDDAGTLLEALPRVGVYDQIEITLAINFLVVRKPRPFFRQGSQRLGDQRIGGRPHRDFPGLGFEEPTLHPDDVSEVELLEISIVFPFR